jgi:hypothetical protein
MRSDGGDSSDASCRSSGGKARTHQVDEAPHIPSPFSMGHGQNDGV